MIRRKILLTLFAAGLALAAPAATALAGTPVEPAGPVAPAAPPAPASPQTETIGFWEGTLLGAVQGFTEFLPVSSSGHLAIFHKYFHGKVADKKNNPFIAFDVAVHFATLLAMLLYFWQDILSLLGRRQKLVAWILLGSVPAATVGLLFREHLENMGLYPALVGTAFIINGLLLVGSNFFGVESRRLEDMTWLDSLIIGTAQALAITPGISRSGSTITSGMVCGLHREEAFTFSFLLGMPAIAGAAVLEGRKIQTMALSGSWGGLVAGFLAAFFVGMVAVWLLGKVVKKRNLLPFGLYTILLGLAVILYNAFKG